MHQEMANICCLYQFILSAYSYLSAYMVDNIVWTGLGRYSDPLMPNGDLESMAQLKNHAHKSTLLFLNVPRGLVDTIWWNAHRVNGDGHRWRWLTHGWTEVAMFGEGIHGWNPAISVFSRDEFGTSDYYQNRHPSN